jgi:hypothetical protein
MRRAVVAMAGLLCVCAQVAAGPGAAGVDVSGPVKYLEDGVEVGGRRVAWKEIRSLEDVAPSADALAAEFLRRRQEVKDDVVGQLKLATWALEHGLALEAKEARVPEGWTVVFLAK